MLQAVQHGVGRDIAARAHEDGGARNALAVFFGAGQEQVQGQGIVAHLFQMQPPSHPPGIHHHKDGGGHGQRQPAALEILSELDVMNVRSINPSSPNTA